MIVVARSANQRWIAMRSTTNRSNEPGNHVEVRRLLVNAMRDESIADSLYARPCYENDDNARDNEKRARSRINQEG